MMVRKRKGYLLLEVVIAISIISVLAGFVSMTLITVVKDNRQIRAEKEIYEAAMDMENIIKINVKKSNSLSQILFNDIMIKEFEIDKEYEADAIAFDRTEKNTQYLTSFKRFTISKQVWVSMNEKKSLWFVNMNDNVELSPMAIKNAPKYEAGNYITNIYIKKLDEKSYTLRLALELSGVTGEYSFTVKTI